MPRQNPTEILRLLQAAGVDFIIAGGVAAVLQGVPIDTFDLDIVHSRDPVNIGRLLPVLESLDAVFRIQPERRIRPNVSHLSGNGHLNLTTRLGKLDVLCTIGDHLGYAELLLQSEVMKIAPDLHVRVLHLETLIAIKERLSGEKDRAALPLLRRTLEERRKLGLP